MLLDSVRLLKNEPNEGKQPERVVGDRAATSSEAAAVVPVPILRGIAKIPADSDSTLSALAPKEHVASSVDAVVRPNDTDKRITTPRTETGDQHQHLRLQQQLCALKAKDHFAKLAEVYIIIVLQTKRKPRTNNFFAFQQRKQIKDDNQRHRASGAEGARKRHQEQKQQSKKSRKKAKREKQMNRRQESSAPTSNRRPPRCSPHGERGNNAPHGDRSKTSIERCWPRGASAGSSHNRVINFGGYRRFDPSNAQEHTLSSHRPTSQSPSDVPTLPLSSSSPQDSSGSAKGPQTIPCQTENPETK